MAVDTEPVERALEDPCRKLLTSFCGIPVAQFWADFYLWELVLNANPDLRAIVEIGTWQGGFSRYLAAQARGRGMAFRTYDSVVPDRPPEEFVRLDVFAFEREVGAYLESRAPLILFCDGGNKPRELCTFPKYLDERSIVIAHDWGTEVLPGDVPGDLSPIYEDACDGLGSMSRVFRVAP